jgi:hypothetical protein
MWQEVLRLVIAPKLAVIVTRHGNDIENRQQLHRKFCEEYGVKPSYSTFSGWCEDLGISFRKRIEVSIPGWKEMPSVQPTWSDKPMVVPVILQEEDAEAPVTWDSPQTEQAPAADPFNIPEVLPGGMRPPAFLNQSDFAN